MQFRKFRKKEIAQTVRVNCRQGGKRRAKKRKNSKERGTA